MAFPSNLSRSFVPLPSPYFVFFLSLPFFSLPLTLSSCCLPPLHPFIPPLPPSLPRRCPFYIPPSVFPSSPLTLPSLLAPPSLLSSWCLPLLHVSQHLFPLPSSSLLSTFSPPLLYSPLPLPTSSINFSPSSLPSLSLSPFKPLFLRGLGQEFPMIQRLLEPINLGGIVSASVFVHSLPSVVFILFILFFYCFLYLFPLSGYILVMASVFSLLFRTLLCFFWHLNTLLCLLFCSPPFSLWLKYKILFLVFISHLFRVEEFTLSLV